MTIRLSIISLAGMARTLVAVGRSSDCDMFLTTAAAAPRSTWTSSPSAGGGLAGFGDGAWVAGFGVLGAPLPDAAGTGAACGGVTAGGAVAGGAGAGFTSTGASPA